MKNKLSIFTVILSLNLLSCETNDDNLNQLTGIYQTENIAEVFQPVMYTNNQEIIDETIVNEYIKRNNITNYISPGNIQHFNETQLRVEFLSGDSIVLKIRDQLVVKGIKTNYSPTEILLQPIDSTVSYINPNPNSSRCDSIETTIKKPTETITEGINLLGWHYWAIYNRYPLLYKDGLLKLPIYAISIRSVGPVVPPIGPIFQCQRTTRYHWLLFDYQKIKPNLISGDTLIIQKMMMPLKRI